MTDQPKKASSVKKERQSLSVTSSVTSSVKSSDKKKKMDWIAWIEEGNPMPTPDDKVSWIGFKKAWRGWYAESLNPEAHPDTRAENRARFDSCIEHFESFGYQVEPIEHTKSVGLIKRDSRVYDGEGQEIVDGLLTTGVTTGWDIYHEENEHAAA